MNKIYLPIGNLKKLHGLQGAINFVSLPWIIDLSLEKKRVFYQKNQKYTPLRVVSQLQRDKKGWLLRFEDCFDATSAAELENQILWVKKTEFSQYSQLWYWPDLIGYKIKYKMHNCGKLRNFYVVPGQLLGEIETREKETFLLPLVNEYLKCIVGKVIYVKKSILELKTTLLNDEQN